MNRLAAISIIAATTVNTDIIPCIKWNPVGMADIDNILHEGSDEHKLMIHDISGEVSELTSEKCWKQAEFNTGCTSFGSA